MPKYAYVRKKIIKYSLVLDVVNGMCIIRKNWSEQIPPPRVEHVSSDYTLLNPQIRGTMYSLHHEIK